MAQSLVSCVHIPVSRRWENAIKSFDGDIFITDDSIGRYNYSFKVLDKYAEFPLFRYIHKSSASKNYALYKAYLSGSKTIFIIDSDCIIPKDFQKKHTKALLQKAGLWDNPLQGTGFYSRGYPCQNRNKRIVANIGLWKGTLDINGTDRTENEPTKPVMSGNRISTSFVPFSGMNIAIIRDAIPALFFLPNIGNLKRHDDIFGGYIFQAIAKKKEDCISYGEPFVFHQTDVVPEEDAIEEKEMRYSQDLFNRIVDRAITKLPIGTYVSMYSDFVDKVEFKGTMFEDFKEPMQLWIKIFKEI